MDTITVFLTGAGAPGAPGIIKCLRKNGERTIRIIGGDMNPHASGKDLVDKFYVLPPAKDPEFIDTVLACCIQEKVKVVLPLVTRELMPFARNKERFAVHGIAVSVMDESILKIANNKVNLLTTLRNLGISTPEFMEVNTVAELEEACRALGYPEKAVCVKTAVGNGSRGVRILDNHKSRYDRFFQEKPNSMYISYEELIRTLSERDEIPQMMVMEYLPGDEYGVESLCVDGKEIISIGRYNSVVLNSITQECRIEYREDAMALAHTVNSTLKLSGLIGYDMKYDRFGHVQVMEINPRLTATVMAYAAGGVNLPYLQIKQLLHEPFDIPQAPYGMRLKRMYQECYFDAAGNQIVW